MVETNIRETEYFSVLFKNINYFFISSFRSRPFLNKTGAYVLTVDERADTKTYILSEGSRCFVLFFLTFHCILHWSRELSIWSSEKLGVLKYAYL